MSKSKRIIAAVQDPQLYQRVEELFERASFSVSRVRSGAGALVLLGNRDYDLVVVGAPLPDLGLDRFLSGLRALDSHGRGSPLLVLVPGEHLNPVRNAIGAERIEVLPVTVGWSEVQRAVSRVLGIAARTSRRMLVELEARVGSGPRLQLLQTVNLSRSGMLVRGGQRPPLGHEVGVSFTLPGQERALQARAVVARHAQAESDGLEGFALHFAEMEDADRRELARFVAADLGEVEPRPAGEPRAASVS